MNSSDQTVVEAIHTLWQPFLLSEESKDFSQPFRRVVIALSGGMDSVVLLHAWGQALKSLTEAWQATIRQATQVVHVHHGLQSSADDWAAFCQQLAIENEWLFRLERIELPEAMIQQRGLEQAARQLRYQALQQGLGEGDWLLTAHHQRDQAETVLLNLFRGSGVAGLQGMPHKKLLTPSKAMHLRPFLNVPYSVLRAYAENHQLQWVEDPSNQQVDFRRNAIRHQVLPAIERHWPQVQKKVAETAEHLQEANALLLELAEADLSQCPQASWPASGLTPAYHWIEMAHLQKLSVARIKNALRLWFKQQLGQTIRQQTLQQVLEQMVLSDSVSAKILLQDWEIWKNFGRIYLVERNFKNNELYNLSKEIYNDFRFEVINPAALEQIDVEAWSSFAKAKQSARFQSSGRYQKWFQKMKIPPWQRANWPGIWIENRFILIGMAECSHCVRLKPGI